MSYTMSHAKRRGCWLSGGAENRRGVLEIEAGPGRLELVCLIAVAVDVVDDLSGSGIGSHADYDKLLGTGAG